jgi:hypothetical protein
MAEVKNQSEPPHVGCYSESVKFPGAASTVRSDDRRNESLALPTQFCFDNANIAGKVAAMTESEQDEQSEIISHFILG